MGIAFWATGIPGGRLSRSSFPEKRFGSSLKITIISRNEGFMYVSLRFFSNLLVNRKILENIGC